MSSRWGALVVSVLTLAVWGGVSPVHGASPMVEKNLFAPERRPDVSEPAAQSSGGSSDAALRSLQLDAVMVFGETRRAILRSKARRTPQGIPRGQVESPYISVVEGDQVGDFKVVKIEAKSIQLEKDGQLHELSLFAEGKVVPPPPALPSGPMMDAPGLPPGLETPPAMPAGIGGGRVPPPQSLSPAMEQGAVGTLPGMPGSEHSESVNPLQVEGEEQPSADAEGSPSPEFSDESRQTP